MTKTVFVDEAGYVFVNKEKLPTHLTLKEATLLRAVLRRKGVCTKEFLLQELYGGRDAPLIKIIDVFVCKLRKKLGGHDMYDTVRGRGFVRNDGYVMEDEEAALGITFKLRKRLDDLALATGRSADELGAELLAAAVKIAEERAWK